MRIIVRSSNVVEEPTNLLEVVRKIQMREAREALSQHENVRSAPTRQADPEKVSRKRKYRGTR